MYRCQFPLCNFETENRQLINLHHIKPKELGGSDHKSNKIWLCATCHNRIYIKKSKSGIHSINSRQKIQIAGIMTSTAGRVLLYKDFNENNQFYSYSKHQVLKAPE